MMKIACGYTFNVRARWLEGEEEVWWRWSWLTAMCVNKEEPGLGRNLDL
jgi:hypothetical protein